MADTNAGKLIYDVEFHLQEMATGQKEINSRLSSVESDFKSLGAVISRVAGGIAAALSVREIANYANAWIDVNNKLINSVKASETLADVTQRVFNISQDTRSSLEATATLYGRLERATRSAGVSAADLAKLTSTINKGLIVSGATTAEASSTMIQLSQALASGVLRGEEFNSISENGSRISLALAQSLGVTQGQLRAMAAQGKLTTDIVVKGLLSQGDVIAKEFGNTVVTMGQSFEVAGNNITKFVGESATVKSFLSVFNSSVVTLSENLDIASSVLISAIAIIGARYTGALASATTEQLRGIVAKQAAIKAESALSSAALSTARAENAQAIAANNSAQAELRAAEARLASSNALSGKDAALKRVQAATIAADAATKSLTASETALSSATARSAAAASAAATSWNIARGALAFIGGPAGAAMLAAAALLYFYQKAEEAKTAAVELAGGVNTLIGKMKEMSNLQVEAEIAKLRQSMPALAEVVQEATIAWQRTNIEVANAQKELSKYAADSDEGKRAARDLTEAQDKQTIATSELTKARNAMGQATNGVNILQEQLNGRFKTGIDLLKRDGQEAGIAAGMMSKLGDMINLASRAKDKFNSTSLQVTRSADADKILADLQQENKLLAIKDERQRAITKAADQAVAKGAQKDSTQLKQIEDEAAKNYDLNKAIADGKKEKSAATKEENKAAAENARRVKQLDELKAGTEALTLTEQRRYREAAQAEAVSKLGKDATAAQIQQARDLAGQEFDIKQRINDRKAASDANYYAAADLKRQDDLDQTDRMLKAELISFDQAQARKLQIAADYQKSIAEATAAKDVTPQNELKGMVDPIQALANEHTKKLALIAQFETQKGQLTANGLALQNAANMEYEKQRSDAMWLLWSQQSEGNKLLSDAFESLSSNASNAFTGIITGSMTAQDAMRSLTSNALNSLINGFVQMGIEWVKSAIMGSTAQVAATAATTTASVAGIATTTTASTAAAGTTLAAWLPAALVASVGTFGAAATIGGAALLGAFALSKVVGARKNGGPVSAGSMYQVGEGGMPEIYQAAGKQYMIPGDNGKVISNKDAFGGGGPVVNLNIQNYSTAQIDQRTTQGSNGSVTIDMIIADIDQGGGIRQAILRNTSATAKARS